MDDIKDFDVNELKISSDEMKEYDTGKPYPSYEPNTIEEQREFSLENSRKSALRKSPFSLISDFPMENYSYIT